MCRVDSIEVASPGATPNGCASISDKQAESQKIDIECIGVANEDDIPDGGWRAWLVVLGAALALFSSFGVVNSYGVFQSYYKDHRLTHENQSILASIGAVQLFLVYALGPLFGKIFDSNGTTLLLPIGTFCIVASHLLLSFARPDQFYQYFLSQAVLFGIGASAVITPSIAIIRQYFKRRLSFALGVVLAGSSGGGLAFPIIFAKLFPRIGFAWTLRITSLICFVCLVITCFSLKIRLPSTPCKTRDILLFFDLGGFREARYCCLAASLFFTLYGLFIPYVYLRQYAELQGMSSSLSQYLLPMINGSTVVSRLVPGFLADKTGPLNLMLPMTIIAGLLSLSLTLPLNGDAPIITFAILYGAFAGGFMALLPSYLAKIIPRPVYGARMGTIYMFIAFGTLLGTPTGGEIAHGGHIRDFKNVFGFAGIMITVGGLLIGVAWCLEARRVFRTASDKAKLTWRSFCF